jgi:hypothetical protein
MLPVVILSLVAAFIGAALAAVVTLFLAGSARLGDLGIFLFLTDPIIAGILVFIFVFRILGGFKGRSSV